MKNQISYAVEDTIRDQMIADVKTAFGRLKDLPKDLPPASKHSQYMGQGSKGYVQDCLAAAKSNPEVLPALFNYNEFKKDWDLVNSLDPILNELLPFTAMLVNMRALAGQDLMSASNEVKKNFNSAAKTDAKYRSISDNLNKRYERSKNDKVESPTLPAK